MIINPYTFLNPIFNGVTAAWSLSEATGKVRRENLGSGMDFFPQNVTTVSGKSKFSGGVNSYMTADAPAIGLGSDTSFTVFFMITPSSLPAGTYEVMCKGEEVFAATAEWRVYLSTNTINFRLYYGVSSQITLSGTLTNGVENVVQFGYDAVNDIASLKINSGALITTAHSGGTRSNRGTGFGAFTIGNECGLYQKLLNTTSINSAIRNVIFFKDTYKTAAEQATLRTEVMTNGFPWINLPELDYYLDPNTFDSSEKKQYYSFRDLSTLFQDVTETIPVGSDNDPIRVALSKWSGDKVTAPSDGVRPLWKAATINGDGSAYSNGTDTRMNSTNKFQNTEADFTIFVVAKNDRNASGAGSHWASNQAGTNSYLTQTGSDYGNGYFAGHKTASGSGGACNSGRILYPTSFNIFEAFSVSQLFSCLANGNCPPYTDYKKSNTNPADYDTLFKDTKLNVWWALGNLSDIMMIEKTLTVIDRARIRKWLELETGVVAIYAGY